MLVIMVHRNVDMEVLQMALEPSKAQNGEKKEVSETSTSHSHHSEDFISKRLWVMHGAIMFGREFCYAMETALVTPVLLQIGLPEQYYSLTWFLSPILGLILTPVLGSASDRCTLKWGRRRPFILGLCIGVLIGVAFFLNGSVVGLSLGDTLGDQPIGIVLTVLGVVILDFCLDGLDGPIRSYLLDVAEGEEQDMALNIHAFSAGVGGALGYMLGGTNWKNTLLGHVFKAQEQVLFFFASIIFVISVTLHLFSIKECPFDPHHEVLKEEEADSSSSIQLNGSLACTRLVPQLDLIIEENAFDTYKDNLSMKEIQMDFLNMRSKSDSALAVPDSPIKLDPDLDLKLDEPFFNYVGPIERHNIKTDNENCLNGTCLEPQHSSLYPDISHNDKDCYFAATMVNSGDCESNPATIVGATNLQSTRTGIRQPNTNIRCRLPSFYRQPSFTFIYRGRVGFQRPCHHFNTSRLMKSSRSLNDIDSLAQCQEHQNVQRCGSTLTATEEEGEECEEEIGTATTVKLLWLSMLKMPPQLWRLCVCHLLTWFSIISQAVFYTDFMGQVIYHGDPMAAANSTDLQDYHKGVQMGCWGLVIYAANSAICSALLQKYLDNYDLSIKIIYMVGTLGFSVGTAIMAMFPNVYVAMVMISSMGIISMSISYCPYALLGQYHDIKEYIRHSPGNSRRGFGIDCAILTCQVYISQILVASALGTVVKAVGTVRVIPMVASGGSFISFLTATFLVIYPNTPEDNEEEQAERQVIAP